MWNYLTTGLSTLGSGIANVGGGMWDYMTGAMPNQANATNPMWGNSLMGDLSGLFTSEQGTNMLGTGIAGLNAYNQYQFNKEAADALDRQLGMQEEAFGRDKESYEQRQNLQF
jgi:hypothetical protein